MSEVIALLLWCCIDFVLIFTGKIVIAIASFGQWRGEKLRSSEGRLYSGAGALWFKRDGQRVITATGLLFIGVLFYVLLALISFWYFSRK